MSVAALRRLAAIARSTAAWVVLRPDFLDPAGNSQQETRTGKARQGKAGPGRLSV
jgi:hypothetical protein